MSVASTLTNGSRSTHPTSTNCNPRPGIYKLLNANSGTAIDLSGSDGKSIIGFPEGQAENQQWHIAPLGPGYTICNVRNPYAYLSIIFDGTNGPQIGSSPYPTSWEIEIFNLKESVYRIRWPNSNRVFDLRDWGSPEPGTLVDLHVEGLPIHPCQLWRFVEVEIPDIADEVETVSNDSDAGDWQSVAEGPTDIPPAGTSSTKTLADTVIDAEGLRVGGNGEVAITTTTTTVTTTVTRVKRLNVG